jgi:hypothetical protein
MSQIDRFQIAYLATTSLHPNPRNPKHHPEKQLALLVTAIRESRKLSPVAIDEERMILAGHGRWLAAIKLGLSEGPTITMHFPSEEAKTPGSPRALPIPSQSRAEPSRADSSSPARTFAAAAAANFSALSSTS